LARAAPGIDRSFSTFLAEAYEANAAIASVSAI
jgi:hypothetical protein